MSMLSRGVSAGFDVYSKGQFKNYEKQLREEEAEAQLARDQHMESYKDSLITARTMKLRENEIGIQREQEQSGFVLNGKPLTNFDYKNLPQDQKDQAMNVSDARIYEAQKEKLSMTSFDRELNDTLIAEDAGKFYDLAVARDPELANILPKQQLIDNMLYIDAASKGGNPLSNTEKIDLIKAQNKMWTEMEAAGSPEYKELVAQYGPEKARERFIMKGLASPAFGGTSMGDKASRSAAEAKAQKFKDQLDTLPYDDAIKLIMDNEGIKSIKEAEKLLKEENGRERPKEEGPEPSASADKEYGFTHSVKDFANKAGIYMPENKGKGTPLVTEGLLDENLFGM
jgi:hypothetical protein